jgi:hypothetical protein
MQAAIAAIDLCVVPTLTFDCLFAFLVLGHGRRQLLWFAVTRHPTAEWLAQQLVEAFPWGTAPTYLACQAGRALQPRPVLQSLGCEAERPRRTSFLPACLNLSASSCGSIPSASITALTMESDKISVSVGSR